MISYVLLSSVMVGWVSGFETLRAQLDAVAQQAEDEWSLIDLPRSTKKSWLFKRAYQHAKSELFTPAVEALDQVYAVIGDRCDYQDINIDDVSKVFSQISFGSDLRKVSTAQTKQSINSEQWKTYADACVNIVRCYYADELKERNIERDQFTSYTTQTNQSCKWIVSSQFAVSYQQTATHKKITTSNYGEDIFYNWSDKDAPYDLMIDVENIGNALFRANTPVIAAQVYNLPDGVWESDLPPPDPSEVTIDDTINPQDLERQERYAPSQWVPPELPEEVWLQYPYPNIPPEPDQESNLPPWICIDGGAYQWEENEWWYEEEQQEQEEVDQYLDDLELTDLELSVLIAQRYTREQEENTADDDEENDPDPPSPWNPDYLPDLEWDDLEAVKEHVQWCIEQFTDYKKDSRRKTLRKSITQPTKFTQCVFQGLCKEIWDPSWLGIYTVKICKEPRKWGWIVGHQWVKSVEEVIDEMNTVCRSLQESGQLLKHNKTKDHMEHRMMNLKLWNIFSFGLSVVFDEPKQVDDYAQRKREQIEKSNLLEKRLLWVNQKLTSLQQRNKYVVTARPLRSEQNKSYNSNARNSTLITQQENEDIQQSIQAHELANDAQLVAKTQMTQYFIDFIDENIKYWRASWDYTKSLKDTRVYGFNKKFK